MTIAFVLGNGVSRKGISPDDLQKLGKVYGCNALYREFTPDALVSTDRPIATKIQESGYSKLNKFYTRKPTPGSGALPVPDKYFGYSSGPIAVGLAAIDQHHVIYLLGFDMAPNTNQKFNNVYAGTEFYKPMNATPTYTGNWIKQIKTIVQDFPRCRFIRVKGETTGTISEFDRFSNLEHISLHEFLNQHSLTMR